MDLRELSMIVFVLCLLYNKAVTAPVSDNQSGTGHQTDLDGTFLFELGTNISSPRLRLIGQTFQRYDDESKVIEQRLSNETKAVEQRLSSESKAVERRLSNETKAVEQRLADEIKAAEKRLTDTICEQRQPCAEWESWSTCNVNTGYGMRSRTRDCTSNKKICSNVDTTDLATVESGVCEGWCPGTYNYTSGYCLKLYNTQKMAQYDAQTACQHDGGHLVNVNTKAKSDVMHAILNSHGITSEEVWINGNRTQTAGSWHYTYGSAPDFDNWHSSEPSNGSSELCKCDNNSGRVWYDKSCSSAYYFVCEVV